MTGDTVSEPQHTAIGEWEVDIFCYVKFIRYGPVQDGMTLEVSHRGHTIRVPISRDVGREIGEALVSATLSTWEEDFGE